MKNSENGFELRKRSSSHHEITSLMPENLRENPDKEVHGRQLQNQDLVCVLET